MKRTPLRKRRKTRKGQIAKSTLDNLWSERIRERDKYCRLTTWFGGVVECAGNLEACHMYSKKAYPNTRWALGNGNALCSKHHFFVHQNPVQAARFYESLWGRQHLDSLWILARAVGKVDRAVVKAYLLEKA